MRDKRKLANVDEGKLPNSELKNVSQWWVKERYPMVDMKKVFLMVEYKNLLNG